MSLSVTVLLMASQYSHYNFNQSLVAIVPSLTANKLLITSCHADRVESTWKQKAATTIVLVMVRRGPSSSRESSHTVIRICAASTIIFDGNDDENNDEDGDDEDDDYGDMIY